jgi:hypothetical protein
MGVHPPGEERESPRKWKILLNEGHVAAFHSVDGMTLHGTALYASLPRLCGPRELALQCVRLRLVVSKLFLVDV